MDLGLRDKLVIVGGGAGALGSATANAFRKEGAEVVVADIKNGIDLSDPVAVRRFFATLRGKYPKLDVFCSMVHGNGAGAGILSVTPDEVEKELRGTFLAALWPIQEATKWMAECGGGSIIAVSSINTTLGLNEVAYDAAKGSLERLIPDIATGCGKYRIHAVGIRPGTIANTPSWEGRQEDLFTITKTIPDKKITTTEEVARAIVFLASPAGVIFNGSILNAARGWGLSGPIVNWKGGD